jgi:hypothetical protein
MHDWSLDQLVAFAKKELPPADAERVRAHLDAGCRLCRRRLGQLQAILAVAANPTLIDPPGWLVRQARALCSQGPPEPPPGLFKRIRGLLIVDSFAEGRLLGFRRAGPMSRRLLYRAGGYDVDLLIDYLASSQSIDISGQAISFKGPSTTAGAEVKLLRDTGGTRATRTNEFGEFIFDEIQEGVYDLNITLADEEIHIAGLQAVVRPE